MKEARLIAYQTPDATPLATLLKGADAMNVADYGQLSVLEKALRGQPLSVAERRVATYLATCAKSAKDAALSRAVFE